MIFVFGSNLSGIHGAGAARYAHQKLGAKWLVGRGLTGQCYALPTKDHRIRTRSIQDVRNEVMMFIQYAEKHPELEFKVTRVGCGLAGFKDEEIAPLFADAPDNCYFDTKWKPWLPDHVYWGTV